MTTSCLASCLAGCTRSPAPARHRPPGAVSPSRAHPPGPAGSPGPAVAPGPATAAGDRARWSPRPGQAWQWQLTTPVDLRPDVPVYDID
ncbi:hypothetical protein ACRYCC_36030, partial [Actinomadura scrupuli]